MNKIGYIKRMLVFVIWKDNRESWFNLVYQNGKFESNYQLPCIYYGVCNFIVWIFYDKLMLSRRMWPLSAFLSAARTQWKIYWQQKCLFYYQRSNSASKCQFCPLYCSVYIHLLLCSSSLIREVINHKPVRFSTDT